MSSTSQTQLPDPTFSFAFRVHLSTTTGGEWYYEDSVKGVQLSVRSGPDGKNIRSFIITETGERFTDYKLMVEAYKKTDRYIAAALKVL